MARVRVCSVTDLAADSARCVEVGAGQEVLLAHTEDGGWYAVDSFCSHELFSLCEGELWGDDIECPQHGSRFNLRTGKPDVPPAVVPIATFPVRVEGDDVYVEV